MMYLSHLKDAEWWTDRGLALAEFGLKVGLLLLALALMKRVLRVLVDRAFAPIIDRAEPESHSRVSRLRTLQSLTQSIFHYLLIAIGALMLLRELGLDPTSALATAGVAGVAIGFGAQKLVKDVINGFFLLLEDQFSVGDLVTIGSVSGVVEEIGMRVTRIRDDNGRINLLSNGDIVAVTNFSRGRYRLSVDIGVPVDTPKEAVASAVTAAGEDLQEKETALSDVTMLGLVSLDAAKATYRVSAEALPSRRLSAEVELREVVWAQLRAAGVPPA
ncbi:MAG TPA: mechanosensitive ion channel family protein [Armatimonadota bacterium]|jgi:small conductance mechanosensitive channel